MNSWLGPFRAKRYEGGSRDGESGTIPGPLSYATSRHAIVERDLTTGECYIADRCEGEVLVMVVDGGTDSHE